MKRFHVAIAVKDIEQSIALYSQKLGASPEVIIPQQYALWRTQSLNFSIRVISGHQHCPIRHLGWEDPQRNGMTVETDINGIDWEYFSKEDQNNEILALWPETQFKQ